MTDFTPSAVLAGDRFSEVSPRVVLTWYPKENLTVYSSYSEGFRSGTLQTPAVTVAAPSIPASNPDTLKNYEVGAKGNLLDGRVGFDAALYYMEWQGLQQALGVVIANGVVAAALVNGSSASGAGFDLGVTTHPVDGMTLGATLSWNDLTLDAEQLFGPIVMFEKGDRSNRSPELTAGASLEYGFPFGSRGFKGHFAASANYISEQANRTRVAGARSIGVSDPILISRTSFSIRAPEHWTTSLYVDNLNNERGKVEETPFLVPFWATRARPRTIGIQLEYIF
jgi:iron complex outermembrane recepter protein